jgi:hypothetical protein
MFTSDSWQYNHLKLHHPIHLQDARQKNLNIGTSSQCIEHAQNHEYNANIDAVEDLDLFPYLEQIDNIALSQSQPPPPPVLTHTRHSPAPVLHLAISLLSNGDVALWVSLK